MGLGLQLRGLRLLPGGHADSLVLSDPQGASVPRRRMGRGEGPGPLLVLSDAGLPRPLRQRLPECLNPHCTGAGLRAASAGY